MSRGIGEFGPIQEVIPEWAAILIALVTQLGDVWFIAVLVGGIYWFHANKREDVAVIIGLTLAGLSVITALKHVFALPRPDESLVALEALPAIIRPLYEVTASASGYGFPSGHALMTTVVYVSLARRLSVSTYRNRLLAATTVIAIVCFSRVALGVHYLVDVVAGVAVGVAFLLAVEQVLTRYPTEQGTIAFSLALVVSAIALVVSSVDLDAVLLFVASLGTFAGWQFAHSRRDVAEVNRP